MLREKAQKQLHLLGGLICNKGYKLFPGCFYGKNGSGLEMKTSTHLAIQISLNGLKLQEKTKIYEDGSWSQKGTSD